MRPFHHADADADRRNATGADADAPHPKWGPHQPARPPSPMVLLEEAQRQIEDATASTEQAFFYVRMAQSHTLAASDCVGNALAALENGGGSVSRNNDTSAPAAEATAAAAETTVAKAKALAAAVAKPQAPPSSEPEGSHKALTIDDMRAMAELQMPKEKAKATPAKTPSGCLSVIGSRALWFPARSRGSRSRSRSRQQQQQPQPTVAAAAAAGGKGKSKNKNKGGIEAV